MFRFVLGIFYERCFNGFYLGVALLMLHYIYYFTRLGGFAIQLHLHSMLVLQRLIPFQS